MQASSAKEPFDSPDWIFETKLEAIEPGSALVPQSLTFGTEISDHSRRFASLKLAAPQPIRWMTHAGHSPCGISRTCGMRFSISAVRRCFEFRWAENAESRANEARSRIGVGQTRSKPRKQRRKQRRAVRPGQMEVRCSFLRDGSPRACAGGQVWL